MAETMYYVEHNECIQDQSAAILDILLLKVYEESHYLGFVTQFSWNTKSVMWTLNKVLEETQALLYKMYFMLYYRIGKCHLPTKASTQEQII